MCSSVVERYVDIVEVASSILAIPTILGIYKKLQRIYTLCAGDYCEGAIPDPIPNSEVKPFSADGTLS